MKKIKRNDIILFFILFAFSLVIFYQYLEGHFAADTFNIINIGYDNYAIDYSLTDGRIFMGIIGYIAYIVNVPIMLYTIFLEILAIMVTCITIIVLKNIVLSYKPLTKITEKIFLIIVCYYTIFNFTYIEYMYFVECFVMAISILLYMLSAKNIVESNNKKATLLFFLALVSYQGTISAFFIWIILFSLLNNRSIKEIIVNMIKALGIFAIGFLLDNVCIMTVEKIFHTVQSRGFKLETIGNNILFIMQCIPTILKYTSNLFPKYLYIIFVVVIFMVVCLKLVKLNHKKYDKNNELYLLEQIAIIILCVMFCFIPSVMSLSGFWAARMRFSLGAMIGILFIHLIAKTNLIEGKTVYDKILIAIFILYGIINSVNYMYLMNLNKQVNELDEKYVYQIEKDIQEYEKDNHIVVKNISIIVMEENIEKAYYKSMNCKGVGIAVSAIRTQWATQGVLYYYTGRSLKEKEPTEQEKEKYINQVDKNKDYLCMDDTLYISVYMY